uniref:Centromere protein X n=1 Tax=Macaca mulatta TaxID=9544 RepID=A0A5F7ZCF0_MACMU
MALCRGWECKIRPDSTRPFSTLPGAPAAGPAPVSTTTHAVGRLLAQTLQRVLAPRVELPTHPASPASATLTTRLALVPCPGRGPSTEGICSQKSQPPSPRAITSPGVRGEGGAWLTPPLFQELVSRLLHLHFKDDKTKVSGDALQLVAELLKIFVVAVRGVRQARAEDTLRVDVDQLEKVLPQLVGERGSRRQWRCPAGWP